MLVAEFPPLQINLITSTTVMIACTKKGSERPLNIKQITDWIQKSLLTYNTYKM